MTAIPAEKLWEMFCEETGTDINTPYEAWAFGCDPDGLAELVSKGIKTATASGYELYFAEGEEEPLPKIGEYSVILDSKDNAVCVIRTVSVKILPFDEVGSDQAYKEGEGDRSLEYWRCVHEKCFTEEYESYGMEFSHKSKTVCEEFELLYKA